MRARNAGSRRASAARRCAALGRRSAPSAAASSHPAARAPPPRARRPRRRPAGERRRVARAIGQREREHQRLRVGRQRAVAALQQAVQIGAGVGRDVAAPAPRRAGSRSGGARARRRSPRCPATGRRSRPRAPAGSVDVAARPRSAPRRPPPSAARARSSPRTAAPSAARAGTTSSRRARRRRAGRPRRERRRPPGPSSSQTQSGRPARARLQRLRERRARRASAARWASAGRRGVRARADPQPRRQRLEVAAPEVDRPAHVPAAPATATSRATTSNSVRRPEPGAPTSTSVDTRRRALGQPIQGRAQRGPLGAAADEDPGQRIAFGIRERPDRPRRACRRPPTGGSPRAAARARSPGASPGSAASSRANSRSQPSPSPGADRRQRRAPARSACAGPRGRPRPNGGAAAPRLEQRRAQREEIHRRRSARPSAPRAPRSPACRARRRRPAAGGPASPKSIRTARPSPARRTFGGTDVAVHDARARAGARARRPSSCAARCERPRGAPASSAMLARLSTPGPAIRR